MLHLIANYTVNSVRMSFIVSRLLHGTVVEYQHR